MPKDATNQNQEDSSIRSDSFSDEATSAKIDKHLSDINDVISDEDIRNVKVNVGLNEGETAGEAEQAIMKDEETKDISLEDHSKEEKEGQKPNTPWNILGQ